jgi:hypothetical protein
MAMLSRINSEGRISRTLDATADETAKRGVHALSPSMGGVRIARFARKLARPPGI